MRILIHSNAPWVPTGYGSQTALLLPRLRDMGHEVAVSAFYGLSGSPIEWQGHRVYPAGLSDYGVDVVAGHARHFGADLVLTLMDFWKLYPVAEQLAEFKVAAWLPNDCTPLSKADAYALKKSRAVPIAMSEFGVKNLVEAGFGDALYAPHGIDTEVFKPHEDRKALRDELGLADRFVIGICSANRDAVRKGFPEQIAAFARFRKHHNPDAVLLLHTVSRDRGGYDLQEMAADFGISDALVFSDQYAQISGQMTPEMMATWYSACDVFSCCSYAEAFGIPIVEAQACGTPVVVTGGSAMSELCGSGWRVAGDDFWNPVHRAWWSRPRVDAIVKAYEKAKTKAPAYREQARTFALGYDVDKVAGKYWAHAMKELEAA